MKVVLSLHRYAPELNRVQIMPARAARRAVRQQRQRGDFPMLAGFPVVTLRPGRVRLDGVDTIRKARAAFRNRWGYPDGCHGNGVRRCEITVTRDGAVIRRVNGLVDGYREALAARDALARQHKGGRLLTGEVIPDGVATVRMLGPVAGAVYCPQREADAVARWQAVGR
jgi:hypothetical protein